MRPPPAQINRSRAWRKGYDRKVSNRPKRITIVGLPPAPTWGSSLSNPRALWRVHGARTGAASLKSLPSTSPPAGRLAPTSTARLHCASAFRTTAMTQPSTSALHTSALTSLPLLARGKVRDNYAVGDDRILMVASDRLSAFDVIMGEPIPGKGELLTQMALFWFDKLGHIDRKSVV